MNSNDEKILKLIKGKLKKSQQIKCINASEMKEKGVKILHMVWECDINSTND